MNVSTVTILVCTYNRAGFLRETLRAISALPRRGDYEVEIIVVDNNSSDATAKVVADADAAAPALPIRYEFEPLQGKSFALNRGLRCARGEVIAHTDDDVWPDPQWLDRIVAAFRQHPISFAFRTADRGIAQDLGSARDPRLWRRGGVVRARQPGAAAPDRGERRVLAPGPAGRRGLANGPREG